MSFIFEFVNLIDYWVGMEYLICNLLFVDFFVFFNFIVLFYDDLVIINFFGVLGGCVELILLVFIVNFIILEYDEEFFMIGEEFFLEFVNFFYFNVCGRNF